MVVPLLERLTQIEARSSGPLRAELARLMDDLPDDMRKRLKARFDALD
jgi:hypothetical protein